ncbi:MAG: hypothetical protein HY077_08505 [Elusimicrobia bacterium]|nr:hypothetical protein [Elusimicrobiota bacterium]
MDSKDLWREEVFTDRKVGTIRRLTPVKPDGAPDVSRKPYFTGEAQILTPAGSLPLNFEIPGETLEAAVAGYSAAVQTAFHDAMEELKELRRKASSQIVIPQGGASGLSGLGPPPGGGKLKLP